MRTTARLAMLDSGTPAGAATLPVVMLHGWTGSKEDFEPLVPALAVQRRVLAPDLPGHGATPPPADGDYSLQAHVDVVAGALDAAGVDEFHLVGHSHGGLVAQRLAYAMAHRVTSMTLIGSGLGALGDEARAMVIRVATTARDRGMAAAWREVVGDRGDDPPAARTDSEQEEWDAFVRRRFLAMTPGAVLGVASNLVTTMPLGAFLRGIDAPVLVCHGEGDTTWLPHEQRLLARSIAGAAYHAIPDALHSPARENPEGLLSLLVPFLDRAEADDHDARSTTDPVEPPAW